MKFSIRVGDTVEVCRGSRNRNPDETDKRRGRVLRVDRPGGRVIVEGHNMRKKHLRKSPQRPQGGVLQLEAPIAISNVLVVCDDGQAVPVRRAARNKDGKVVRKADAPSA